MTNKRKSRIPKKASLSKKVKDANVYLTDIESKVFGFSQNNKNGKNQEPPYISLKYFQPSFQCFSKWQNNELKSFSKFVEKLRMTSWDQIYKTSGKIGHKSDFGYTPHKNTKNLPNIKQLDMIISPDITFFELRVTGKVRVHGFRMQSAFFLVWLDREHEIYSM
jgi:hypothetical protein